MSSNMHDLPILYYIIHFMKKTNNFLQKAADVMQMCHEPNCVNTVTFGIFYLHHGYRCVQSINSAGLDLNANISWPDLMQMVYVYTDLI